MTSFGGPRWAVDHLAEHASIDALGARPGCPDCFRAWLAVRPNDTDPVVPDAYPFVERRPGARCFLWWHTKGRGALAAAAEDRAVRVRVREVVLAERAERAGPAHPVPEPLTVEREV